MDQGFGRWEWRTGWACRSHDHRGLRCRARRGKFKRFHGHLPENSEHNLAVTVLYVQQDAAIAQLRLTSQPSCRFRIWSEPTRSWSKWQRAEIDVYYTIRPLPRTPGKQVDWKKFGSFSSSETSSRKTPFHFLTPESSGRFRSWSGTTKPWRRWPRAREPAVRSKDSYYKSCMK